jgi:hypothetical protein
MSDRGSDSCGRGQPPHRAFAPMAPEVATRQGMKPRAGRIHAGLTHRDTRTQRAGQPMDRPPRLAPFGVLADGYFAATFAGTNVSDAELMQ